VTLRPITLSVLLSLLSLSGCADSVQYSVGSGVVYHTRCAARMAVEGDTYTALCDPPPCAEGYESKGVGHVAVALDPGVKVIGNAERICVQDIAALARSQAMIVDGKQVSP
jgi:hypothetical protein